MWSRRVVSRNGCKFPPKEGKLKEGQSRLKEVKGIGLISLIEERFVLFFNFIYNFFS